MWADNQALKLQRRAHIMWENDGPQTVFIVKKTGSAKTTAKLKEIATWQVMLQLCSLSGASLHDLTALETCTSGPTAMLLLVSVGTSVTFVCPFSQHHFFDMSALCICIAATPIKVCLQDHCHHAHGTGANVEQYANSSGYRRRASESW